MTWGGQLVVSRPFCSPHVILCTFLESQKGAQADNQCVAQRARGAGVADPLDVGLPMAAFDESPTVIAKAVALCRFRSARKLPGLCLGPNLGCIISDQLLESDSVRSLWEYGQMQSLVARFGRPAQNSDPTIG